MAIICKCPRGFTTEKNGEAGKERGKTKEEEKENERERQTNKQTDKEGWSGRGEGGEISS